MSYDPNQPYWGNPPGGSPRGDSPSNSGAQQGYDPYAQPPTSPPDPGPYQPPEGSYPGGYMPPPTPPGYEGGYAPPQMGQTYYPAYPGPMAPSTSGWAIASLVSSIASWVVLPFIAAILGVIFGHMALNEIRQSDGRLEGRGMAIAGLVIGYVNLGLSLCIGSALIIGLLIAASNMH